MSNSSLGRKEQGSIKLYNTVIRTSGHKHSFCPHMLHTVLPNDGPNQILMRQFYADKAKSLDFLQWNLALIGDSGDNSNINGASFKDLDLPIVSCLSTLTFSDYSITSPEVVS